MLVLGLVPAALPGDGPAPSDPLRDSLVPPPPVPGSSSKNPAEKLRNLQGDLESLKKNEANPPEKATPGNSAPILSEADAMAERLRLKSRLLELIGQLASRAAQPPVPPAPEPPRFPEIDFNRKPTDRSRFIQNLYRAGETKSTLRAIELVPPGEFTGKQASLMKYIRASCHRRLGQLSEAKQLYSELTLSTEDEFLAQCAAWQLEAIRWRIENAAQLDLTRTHAPSK